MPQSRQQFVEQVTTSGLMTAEDVHSFLTTLPADRQPQDGEQLAKELVKHKKLTKYQAEQIYSGKGKSLVLGNYVILDKLGQGGMGMVLKAEHKRMKRLVAIKVMSPAAVKTPDALKRFHREVEAAAKLRHPNIVAADDADEAKGTHFLVMEYVEGTDLHELVRKHGPLPVEQAVRCIIQAARGLEYAHEQGVIHRDIKPANLLMKMASGPLSVAKDSSHGPGTADHGLTIKILDMGLARIDDSVGGSSEGAGLTSTGTIMGTVDYMSPEQAMDTKHADARSDIYSLGCTLYYLLTGRCLYGGDTMMKKLMAHQHTPAPSLSQELTVESREQDKTHSSPILDSQLSSLNSVFWRMVAKKPEDRPQTMTQVIAELERCLAGDAATVTIQRPSGVESGNELQAFLRQISSDSSSQPTSAKSVSNTSATKASTSKSQTARAADPALEATMISSVGEAATDPQTLTLAHADQFGRPKAGVGRFNSRRTIFFAAVAAGVALLVAFSIRNRSEVGPREQAGQDKPAEGAVARTKSGASSAKPGSPTKTTTEADDPERAVAKWVLQNGGQVALLNQGNFIEKVAALPAVPLTVAQVEFRNVPDFTAEGAERLTKLNSLNHVSFQETTLAPNAIRTLARCQRLTSLQVSGGSTTGDVISETLHIPQLRSLAFTRVVATDDFVGRLGQFPHLKFLQMNDCQQVTEEALVRMAAAPPPKLQWLSWGGTKLSKTGMRAIASLPHLNRIGIAFEQLDDAALGELARCPSLSEISLGAKTEVTQAAITELQQSLANCQIRVTTPEQACSLNRSPAYRDAIRRLTARGFGILIHTEAVGATWVHGEAPIPNGEAIYASELNSNPQVPPDLADLQLLLQLSDIQRLGLENLPPDGLRGLLPLKNLMGLSKGGIALAEADVALLPSFSKLSELHVTIPHDAALTTIASLPHLSLLGLHPGSKITEKGLRALESAVNLSDLNLNTPSISREVAQSFANARPDVIVNYLGERLDAEVFPAPRDDKPSPLNAPPPPAKAPFDAKQARAHQEAWARHLGTTVETTNSVAAKMVLIPPGEFLMGAPDSDADATPQEKPQHLVRLTKPFAIGATEVTVGQFRRFVEATKYVTQAESDGQGAFEINPKARRPHYTWKNLELKELVGDEYPVRCVSWEDARRFCEWLSQTEGRVYRLPTEAEWEFACRAGTDTRYSFGNDFSDTPSPPVVGGAALRPVAQLPANPFGLFDMHGSVNEICWDSGPTFTAEPVTDPLGSLAMNVPAVVKGGAVSSSAARLRSSNRYLNDARQFPESNFATLAKGFRVVAEFGSPAVASTKRTFASDEWIDVMPLLNPELDKVDIGRSLGGKNDWRVERGELRYYGDDKSGKLYFPIRCQGPSLEWEFEFTRTAGNISFNSDIPVPGGFVPLAIGNDKIGFVNEVLTDKFQIVNDQRTKLRLRITRAGTDDRLEVFVNEQPLVDWKGQLARHKIEPPQMDSRNPSEHPSLFAHGPTNYSFRAIRIRMLNGGTAESLRPATTGSAEEPWIDWLGPRLKRNEIGGNGWIREGDAFTTERDISGIRVIPDDIHDGAIRVTYLLRDAKGIQINARDRKTDNTDATRELYVAEDNGSLLRISRSRSGTPYKDFVTLPIPSTIARDAPRTLEFRVVGDTLTVTLTVTLNGSLVATATDSTIPVGNFALVALKGVLIQKVEYQSLDEPK